MTIDASVVCMLCAIWLLRAAIALGEGKRAAPRQVVPSPGLDATTTPVQPGGRSTSEEP